MSETTRVVIPYESMDPLAIGATDDESKKHRDTLEVDIPTANLITVVQPDEPAHVGDPTEAARAALAAPTSGPSFAELLAVPCADGPGADETEREAVDQHVGREGRGEVDRHVAGGPLQHVQSGWR